MKRHVNEPGILFLSDGNIRPIYRIYLKIRVSGTFFSFKKTRFQRNQKPISNSQKAVSVHTFHLFSSIFSHSLIFTLYISLGYISICEIDVDLCRKAIRSTWKARHFRNSGFKGSKILNQCENQRQG
ncbi:hypothetical protein [Aquiflexum gelatinilyticum]|uniref:hypothetical protein n=1 Tax=Aquiflexum gelatinilyticum TaxID=2961943 RepID=UPI0021678333|nr:hypothetical protein [Aquiflexum gelatinilyticum]